MFFNVNLTRPGDKMASKAKKPQKSELLTIEQMKMIALRDRGGCCVGCNHKVALDTVLPERLGIKLTPATIAVNVKCSLDRSRRTPFKGSDECPTLRRHNKRCGS
jgi:hypothetical protein